MIYFIQDSGSCHIKIGYTSADDAESRRRALQTGNPETLTLLAIIPGELADEKALHRRFAADRVAGEWFRPTPALLQFILQSLSPPKEELAPGVLAGIVALPDGDVVLVWQLQAGGFAAFQAVSPAEKFDHFAPLRCRIIEPWLGRPLREGEDVDLQHFLCLPALLRLSQASDRFSCRFVNSVAPLSYPGFRVAPSVQPLVWRPGDDLVGLDRDWLPLINGKTIREHVEGRGGPFHACERCGDHFHPDEGEMRGGFFFCNHCCYRLEAD